MATPRGIDNGPGSLRHRVTFAERNSIEDAFGNVSTAWVSRFTVAASIIPRLGGETVTASRLSGRQPVTIRVRRSSATVKVSTDWKATDQAGTEYNIRTAIDPNLGGSYHGMYIDMMAESGVAV